MPILGIDEVGRGPWAGPLVIGAAILPDRFAKNGEPLADESWQDALTDSKKLTAKKRENLAPQITEKAIATGLGWVSVAELDEIGLSSALKLATRRAVCDALKIKDISAIKIDTDRTTKPESELERTSKRRSAQQKANKASLPFTEIIIDGTQNFLKDTPLENLVSVLPKADAKVKEVSAASIIAKVARDNYMKELAEKYPGYGFENHVGYGTAAHKAALEKLGPCPEHRQSFAPVARLLESEPTSKGEAKIAQSPFEGPKTWPSGPERPEKGALRIFANTATAGSHAEQIVADYLKSKGHTILARNHKTKFYEIDIVSATKDHIYFTEVKYRKTNTHGTPLEFIDKKKQKQITFAAESFMKYLSKKLNRPLDDLPSPILAAASVEGPNFELAKWLPLS